MACPLIDDLNNTLVDRFWKPTSAVGDIPLLPCPSNGKKRPGDLTVSCRYRSGGTSLGLFGPASQHCFSLSHDLVDTGGCYGEKLRG